MNVCERRNDSMWLLFIAINLAGGRGVEPLPSDQIEAGNGNTRVPYCKIPGEALPECCALCTQLILDYLGSL